MYIGVYVILVHIIYYTILTIPITFSTTYLFYIQIIYVHICIIHTKNNKYIHTLIVVYVYDTRNLLYQ